MNRENILKADFDTNFLVGNAQKIDIGRFKYGNPILPGEYSLDVYINGQWLGKRKFVLKVLVRMRMQRPVLPQICF